MYGTICERTSDSTRWNGGSGSDSGFAAVNPCPCECDLECAVPNVGFPAQAETLFRAERAVNPNDSSHHAAGRHHNCASSFQKMPWGNLVRWDRPPGLS